MLRVKLLVLSMVLVSVFVLGQSPRDNTTDQEKVKETILVYFDGLINHNEASLRKAFHPSAHLMASINSCFCNIEFEDWVNSQSPEIRDTVNYKNKIVSIEISGNMAVAKVDLEWPKIHYIDYLSFLKVDSEWKIVNKIWFQERKG